MGDLLSGKLVYFFLVAIVDAALLSLILLLWFRRSVRRLMRGRGQAAPGAARAPALDPAADDAAGSAPAPTFAMFEPGHTGPSLGQETLPTPAARRLVLPPLAARGRLVVVYSVAAAAHAAVVTAFQVAAGGGGASWVGVLGRGWINAWPVVPALIALLALDRWGALRTAGAYVLSGGGVLALSTAVSQALRGTLSTAPFTNAFWFAVGLAWTAGAPCLLLMLTGWRRIRAVTPLVLAATLLFAIGAAISGEWLLRAFDSPPVRRGLLDLAAATSTTAAYHAPFMVASLPVGFAAWLLLRGVAGGFAGKAFSDVQLMVDCWWLVVAIEEAALLATGLGAAGVAGAALAFLAYRAAVAIGLARRRPAGVAEDGRLLLLRVFGYQARTEALFDRVAQRWRLRGPVQLIAGPDLAMRAATPGDVLSLLAGRLADQYVADPAAVPDRLARLDFRPDPDDRFRVNQVYCRDEAWRAALVGLLAVSDRVLMDVRSFSIRNEGCLFELEQLLRYLDSPRIVLIVDGTTDIMHLARALDRGWRAAWAAGRARGDGRIALVRLERAGPAEVGLLTRCLLETASPRRVLALGELAGG